MSADGLKVHPAARLIALVPVILIAGGIIAAMLGYRPEGRQHLAVEWRTHTVAQNGFTVSAPGVFIVVRDTMSFDGAEAPAETYSASDLGAEFSVVAVRRPDSDVRPLADVARSMGLSGTDAVESPGGLTTFHHDVTIEGTRTQARLILHERMAYQLIVTAPPASFQPANAERFFGSFRIIPKT